MQSIIAPGKNSLQNSPNGLVFQHSDDQPSPHKQLVEDVELRQNHYTASIQKASVHPPAHLAEVAGR